LGDCAESAAADRDDPEALVGISAPLEAIDVDVAASSTRWRNYGGA